MNQKHTSDKSSPYIKKSKHLYKKNQIHLIICKIKNVGLMNQTPTRKKKKTGKHMTEKIKRQI
jgi:hypothetical protein